MAGRGTDIVLGGNAEFMAKKEMERMGFSPELIVQATGFAETDDQEIIDARKTFRDLNAKFKAEIEPEQAEVLEAGGLYIIGTERHESRRIDNQLRGRAGRQGDIGKSRFFLSLQDDLMRLFAADKINRIMEMVGFSDDEAIESRMVSGSIETAQARVEGRNFNIRKHVLNYDDVNNQQREMIYSQRNEVLDGLDVKSSILKMMHSVIENIITQNTGGNQHAEEWQWETLRMQLVDEFGQFADGELEFDGHEVDRMTIESLTEDIYEKVTEKYKTQEELFGESIREVERVILLRTVDAKWMDHIDSMEQLRQGINLRAYAQRDPVIEYKFEAMDMFDDMIAIIKEETVKMLFHVVPQAKIERTQVAKPMAENLGGDGTVQKKPVVKGEKTGRNDPCPCGSGKKYKHCCLGKE
jgi:preprotein translocase subunit SecA